MDVFEAMKGRRSCRNYLSEHIDDKMVELIIEAGTWAPSPFNMQPWEFIVITSHNMKQEMFAEADRCRKWALEKTGWKWLETYRVDFLKQAPVVIAVIGDRNKTGLDMFMEEGMTGYQAACAAAIQNMHLAAYSLGLGSLWFTLFEKKALKKILEIEESKTPLALVVLGRPETEPTPLPRKSAKDKTRYIR